MPTTTSTWSCAQCSSTFDKSKLLERHALQTSHKAYKCTKCPKTFGKRTALTRHNTTHSDVKTHACRVCGKAFYRKDHCAEHEEICTHRLAVETKARLSASLVGSSSTLNKTAAGETTSRGHPREEATDQATVSRKTHRKMDGDGDQPWPLPTPTTNGLGYNAPQKPQQSSASESEQIGFHGSGLVREDPKHNTSIAAFAIPEALLPIPQQYPASGDLGWRVAPQGQALATYSTPYSQQTGDYFGQNYHVTQQTGDYFGQTHGKQPGDYFGQTHGKQTGDYFGQTHHGTP